MVSTTLASGIGYAVPKSCQKITFAEVAWPGVMVKTAVASMIMESLGYKVATQSLSVPVVMASLKNKDVDIFVGNWMPAAEKVIRPYLNDGSIETIQTNIPDAKYTMVVPTYLANKGLKDFKDIAKFGKELDYKIHGIEPGNSGNAIILKMIKENKFGLGKFKLIESSTNGMLAQVTRMKRGKKAIVFLGWTPHPMNADHKLTYLSGGDDTFGPNYGGATVHTISRKGFVSACQNAGSFLKNMKLTSKDQSAMMVPLVNDGLEPKEAARSWIKTNLAIVNKWLSNVKTIDNKSGKEALAAYLKKSPS